MGSVVGGRDYRNISTSTNQQGMQTIRTTYTLTEQDVSNEFANVRVLWPTPFADTFYTIVVSIADPQGDITGESFFGGDIFNITAQGFMVSVTIESAPVAGNQLIVHAIAFHD